MIEMENERKFRLAVFLARVELDFIDQLIKDMYYKHDKKVSRPRMIGSIISAFREGKTKETLIERRKYVRICERADVECRPLESLEEHTSTYTKNVSEKGIMIHLDKKVAVNTVLELSIKHPDQESMFCIGKVIWIKKAKDGDGYNAGIELTYVRDEDRLKFNRQIFECNQNHKEN